MAQLNMNLAGFQTYDDNFELLPPGEYPVRITSGEVRFPKNGGSQYLNLRYDVLDGPKKGRVLFDTINLWSQNTTAREIAARKLKSIGVAIRIANPDYIGDSDELLQGEMVVRVAIRKDDTGQYGDKNDIKGYKPLAGVAVGGSTMPVTGGAATPPPPMSEPMPAKAATPWG